jgi:lysozyme
MAGATDFTALLLIKSFEGCRLEAYQDAGGVWTIGFGHTGPEVREGLTWTQEEADAALLSDIIRARGEAQKAVTVPLTDRQWAALVSFVFNLGAGALRDSTLLKLINQSRFLEAAKEFPKWDHDGGREAKGLLIRRVKEALLFLEGS